MTILDDAPPGPHAHLTGRDAPTTPRSAAVAAAVALAAVLLGACAAPPPLEPTTTTAPIAPTTTSSTTTTTPTAPSWDPTDRLPTTWGAEVAPDVFDVAYDPDSGFEDRVADLYLPRAGVTRGLILYLHGGGFTGGHRGLLGEHAGPLLRQLDRGFAILNIEYRKDPFPAAVHDVDAAVAFARSDTGRALGIDTSSVVLAGHSAGATIAAVHALGANNTSSGPLGELHSVDGWIAVSGAMELDMTDAGGARHSWGAGDAAEASPAALLDRGDPPGLIIHGDRDPIVPATHAMAFRDRAALLGFPGLTTEIVSAAPDDCRGHLPMCGASMRILDQFLDHVAASPA